MKIENPADRDKKIRCDALVDTGASHMVLPTAWRDRLGELEVAGRVRLELATQASAEGTVCGPVRIQIEGFRPIFSEVLFVDMEPENGDYEPLIGSIVLEQSQAAVDMVGHRLIHGKRLDLKASVHGAAQPEPLFAPEGRRESRPGIHARYTDRAARPESRRDD